MTCYPDPHTPQPTTASPHPRSARQLAKSHLQYLSSQVRVAGTGPMRAGQAVSNPFAPCIYCSSHHLGPIHLHIHSPTFQHLNSPALPLTQSTHPPSQLSELHFLPRVFSLLRSIGSVCSFVQTPSSLVLSLNFSPSCSFIRASLLWFPTSNKSCRPLTFRQRQARDWQTPKPNKACSAKHLLLRHDGAVDPTYSLCAGPPSASPRRVFSRMPPTQLLPTGGCPA